MEELEEWRGGWTEGVNVNHLVQLHPYWHVEEEQEEDLQVSQMKARVAWAWAETLEA